MWFAPLATYLGPIPQRHEAHPRILENESIPVRPCIQTIPIVGSLVQSIVRAVFQSRFAPVLLAPPHDAISRTIVTSYWMPNGSARGA